MTKTDKSFSLFDFCKRRADELIEKTEDESFKVYLLGLQNKKIIQPNRFYPKPDFLDYHYQKFLNIIK